MPEKGPSIQSHAAPLAILKERLQAGEVPLGETADRRFDLMGEAREVLP
jgi:hypothetical protein